METLLTKAGITSLLTLSLMEIVLGIDNIIFISIVAAKLPALQQNKARQLGLSLALLVRIGLLFIITWIVGLKEELFYVFDIGISGRDLILLGGGIFLIAKTVSEIHEKLEGPAHKYGDDKESKKVSFVAIIIQIVLIDIVFSFDSILTAIGLAEHIEVMVAAVVISMAVMFVFARRISIFVNRRPTIKMLALAFLILIGVLLVAEAFDQHVNKGYIYFAMAFALVVEMLNIKMRSNAAKPVKLRGMGDIEKIMEGKTPSADNTKNIKKRRSIKNKKLKGKAAKSAEPTAAPDAGGELSKALVPPSNTALNEEKRTHKQKSSKRRKRKRPNDRPDALSKAD